MTLILAGAALLLLWLFAGKGLKKLTFWDGAALGAAIVGAVLLLKGKPLIGGGIFAGAATWLMLSFRKGRAKRPLPPRAEPKWTQAQSVADARALLGVEADAGAEEIRAAHRKLIALTHPDRGGTPALAAQINDARDLLLGMLER